MDELISYRPLRLTVSGGKVHVDVFVGAPIDGADTEHMEAGKFALRLGRAVESFLGCEPRAAVMIETLAAKSEP